MSLSVKKVLLLDNVDPAAENILKRNNISATLDSAKYGQKELITELQVRRKWYFGLSYKIFTIDVTI